MIDTRNNFGENIHNLKLSIDMSDWCDMVILSLTNKCLVRFYNTKITTIWITLVLEHKEALDLLEKIQVHPKDHKVKLFQNK